MFFFVISIFCLIYAAKSVSCALDMILFAFELRVQRNLTKCVLKYHVCALGLTRSTQCGIAMNLPHLDHVIRSGNIEFGGFKITKNSKKLRIARKYTRLCAAP